jgi:hypothetical protein
MEAASIEEGDVFPALSPLGNALAALNEEEDIPDEAVELEPSFKRYLGTLKDSRKKRYRNRVSNYKNWAAEHYNRSTSTLDTLYQHMMWLRISLYLASTV